jgi:hypothetical protein
MDSGIYGGFGLSFCAGRGKFCPRENGTPVTRVGLTRGNEPVAFAPRRRDEQTTERSDHDDR